RPVRGAPVSRPARRRDGVGARVVSREQDVAPRSSRRGGWRPGILRVPLRGGIRGPIHARLVHLPRDCRAGVQRTVPDPRVWHHGVDTRALRCLRDGALTQARAAANFRTTSLADSTPWMPSTLFPACQYSSAPFPL